MTCYSIEPRTRKHGFSLFARNLSKNLSATNTGLDAAKTVFTKNYSKKNLKQQVI